MLQSAIPSLQRVVGGEGGHCIQVSASEVVAYPNFVEFRCGNVTAGSGASVITRTIDTPTFGWRYSVTSSTGPWQQLSTRTVFTGNMAAYTAYFGPTEFGTGKYGQLNVTVATDDRDNTAETATLEAQLPDDVVMACDPTVSATGDSIDFGSISRQGAGYSSSTGSIELTLTAASAGCTGTARNWTIQVSASIMDGPGDAEIPASAISYDGTAAKASPPTGLTTEQTPPALGTTSDSTTRIATGSEIVESGATWDVAFRIDPPNDLPPGIYNGTITIDIASGS